MSIDLPFIQDMDELSMIKFAIFVPPNSEKPKKVKKCHKKTKRAQFHEFEKSKNIESCVFTIGNFLCSWIFEFQKNG